MIDRGISENYIIYWMDAAAEHGLEWLTRIDRGLNSGMYYARHCRVGASSLTQLYDDALIKFGRHPALAAEYLRRMLRELAEPTPVDDGLPPPDSWVWEHLRSQAWHYSLPRYTPTTPPPRSARHPRSSR